MVLCYFSLLLLKNNYYISKFLHTYFFISNIYLFVVDSFFN